MRIWFKPIYINKTYWHFETKFSANNVFNVRANWSCASLKYNRTENSLNSLEWSLNEVEKGREGLLIHIRWIQYISIQSLEVIYG